MNNAIPMVVRMSKYGATLTVGSMARDDWRASQARAMRIAAVATEASGYDCVVSVANNTVTAEACELGTAESCAALLERAMLTVGAS